MSSKSYFINITRHLYGSHHLGNSKGLRSMPETARNEDEGQIQFLINRIITNGFIISVTRVTQMTFISNPENAPFEPESRRFFIRLLPLITGHRDYILLIPKPPKKDWREPTWRPDMEKTLPHPDAQTLQTPAFRSRCHEGSAWNKRPSRKRFPTPSQ